MKRSSVALLDRWGVVPLARTWQRARSVILTYHGVLDAGGGDDDYLNHNFIAAECFEAQMRYICRHYRPLALRDLISYYREGRTPPERSVAVTFDDGFANNFSVAFPILRRHGVPFTVFVTTGLLDTPGAMLWTERAKRSLYLYPERSATIRLAGTDLTLDLSSTSSRADACKSVLQRMKRLAPNARNQALDNLEAVCGTQPIREHEHGRYDFLTWSQTREMAAAGVEIGSHTVSHPILTTLDPDALQSELSQSKRQVEMSLNRECFAFAYPNGSQADFGPREKEALRACGYTCGVSLKGTLNDRPELYELDRINVGRHLDMPAFRVAMTGLLGTARRTRDRIVATTQRGQTSPARGA